MAPEQGPNSSDVSCGKPNQPTTNHPGEGQDSARSSRSLRTDSLNWIYLLRKDKLVEVCRQHGITMNEGSTVNHLRRQLSELVQAKRQRASSENLLRSLEEEVMDEEQKAAIEKPQAEFSIQVPSLTEDGPKNETRKLSDVDVMATIRRWDLVYDGGENLMEFIERLEELAECYGFEQSRLLCSLLEILKGRALQWYRVKRTSITSWDGFKREATRFFLPRRYLANLEEAIYHRKQGPREKAKDYIINLQTLIRQHPDLQKRDHTDRIYDGLRCEYKLYVRRVDFTTMDELMDLTEEYELLRREEARQRPQPNHCIGPTTTEASYERTQNCWRCKQPGHFRRECQNVSIIFCSRCGRNGILSRDCECGEQNLSVPKYDGRFYLNTTLFGTAVNALVDTGATLTYIGATVLQLLKTHRVRPRNYRRTVQLADGSCIESLSVYPITVTVNGQDTSLLASALENLAEPIILGMDFLRQRNTEILIDGIRLQAQDLPGNDQLNYLSTITSRRDLTSAQTGHLNSVLDTAKTSLNSLQGSCTAGTRKISMKNSNKVLEIKQSQPKGYKRRLIQVNWISQTMERKASRTIPLGKRKDNLRQTAMPKAIKTFTPPLEARPIIKNVQSSLVTKSGDKQVDKLAQEIWSRRKIDAPYHPTSSLPPLAPLSNVQKVSPPPLPDDVPPLASICTGKSPSKVAEPQPPNPSWANIVKKEEGGVPKKMRTTEDDFYDDILTLCEEPAEVAITKDEDLFKDIVVKNPGTTKRKRWMVYPKDRPRVEVIVANGVVTMRCSGQTKTFPL